MSFQANGGEDHQFDDYHLNDDILMNTNGNNLNEHLNEDTPHDGFSYNSDQFNNHTSEDYHLVRGW